MGGILDAAVDGIVKNKKSLKSYKKILKIDKGVDRSMTAHVYFGCNRDWKKM